MVKIRFQRMGRKKRPHYRIVAIAASRSGTSRPLEILGFFNPFFPKDRIRLYQEPTLRWYLKGARATDAAHAIFRHVGLVALINKLRRKILTPEDALIEARKADVALKEAIAEQQRPAPIHIPAPSIIMPAPAVAAESKEDSPAASAPKEARSKESHSKEARSKESHSKEARSKKRTPKEGAVDASVEEKTKSE